MKNIKLLMILIAVFIAGFLVIFNIQKALKKPEVKPAAEEAAPDEPQAEHKVLSFNLEGLTDKGGKKWEVSGESAESISENEIKMNNVVAKAYGDDTEATIKGDEGVYDKQKNNVKLEKNVNAVIYHTADAAKNYLDLSEMDNAGGDKKTEEAPGGEKKGKTVITCDSDVTFDYEKNRAYFNKNVKVVTDDGNIDADRITVILDPDTRKIKEIVAEGSVKITRGQNVSYSEKATYVEASKKIVLSGRPRLVLYQEGSGVETEFLK